MKVLIFHPTQLPPKDYGGVERIVLWLAKGLVERGHEVWVAAFPGSRLPAGAKLWEVKPENSSPEILLTRDLPPGIDLIHFFTPPSLELAADLKIPYVFTLQGNGQEGERFPKNTVFISQDHARRHGGRVCVYNSVDPDEHVFEPERKNDSYLFLSKTSWKVKNLTGAIDFCRRANVPLKIAGGDRPYITRAEVLIRSFLRGPKMQWIGPVNGKAKAELMARAKAFLFPVIWPEPFGIVIAEALISGTPVLGSRRGSVPELVTPDVGAILDTEEEWIEMLSRKKLPWEPAVCRQRAMERFHFRVMCAAYETVYQKVLSGVPLHENQPVANAWAYEEIAKKSDQEIGAST